MDSSVTRSHVCVCECVRAKAPGLLSQCGTVRSKRSPVWQGNWHMLWMSVKLQNFDLFLFGERPLNVLENVFVCFPSQ